MSLFCLLPRARFLRRVAALLSVWPVIFFSLPSLAQRDPTVPPPVLSAPAASDAPAGLVLESGGVSVLRRDGVPYLVLGTRVYAQGQTVGSTKIARISETEIWLLENGKVRKVAVFGGITHRAAAPQPAMPAMPQTPPLPVVDWPTGAEFEL